MISVVNTRDPENCLEALYGHAIDVLQLVYALLEELSCARYMVPGIRVLNLLSRLLRGMILSRIYGTYKIYIFRYFY